MTILERNELFSDCKKLIGFTIYKNLTLIKALRLDTEDVSQELAICALKAIENFDESRGMKLKNFILSKLQYEILNIRQHHNRQCRAVDTTTLSLDCLAVDDDGEKNTIEIPVTVDYESDMVINEALEILSENEKEVLNLKMAGISLTEKKQLRYMDRVRKKFTRHYRMESFYEKQS